MKATGIVRKIDELGRVVIPKGIRTKTGMTEGTHVEFYVDDGKIILTKFQSACVFCASEEDLVEIKERTVCKACLEELRSLN